MPASKSLNYPVHSSRPKVALYAAVAFSLLAALIHLWAMPEHFEEWWGYGTFFLVSAIVQGFYGAALLRWPRRPLLLLGIGGNLSIVALYLLTRTVRIPFFGPHAGEVEGVGGGPRWHPGGVVEQGGSPRLATRSSPPSGRVRYTAEVGSPAVDGCG